MKYYKVAQWYDTITEVEVSRITESCVYVVGQDGKERRNGKATSYEHYFPTFNEAKDHIDRRFVSKIEALEKQLSTEKSKYELFKSKHQ